ncbi:hypothetical protein [Acidisphaera sp. S103]|uniref:hypothetical protein n=1 Tax=Acidisphaera sp. S103 TaxID=1747223 RepID=UPI00131C411E|nr:hypothetical protein [Acidisphaera sp. S103]
MIIDEIRLSGGQILRIARSRDAAPPIPGRFQIRSAAEVRQLLWGMRHDLAAETTLRSWYTFYLHGDVLRSFDQVIDGLAHAVENDVISLRRYIVGFSGRGIAQVAAEAGRLAGLEPPRDNTPIDFKDDNGRQVFAETPGHTAMKKPKKPEGNFFVDQGVSVKNAGLLRYDRFPLFVQGSLWDMQRVDGRVVQDFIDFATVAIGLYCASAEMEMREVLTRQNEYAILWSDFSKASLDKEYTHLPVRNVNNTVKGYALYASGSIRPTGGK